VSDYFDGILLICNNKSSPRYANNLNHEIKKSNNDNSLFIKH